MITSAKDFLIAKSGSGSSFNLIFHKHSGGDKALNNKLRARKQIESY
jgi:hypothetical protein